MHDSKGGRVESQHNQAEESWQLHVNDPAGLSRPAEAVRKMWPLLGREACSSSLFVGFAITLVSRQ
jgi:hypothetical protein